MSNTELQSELARVVDEISGMAELGVSAEPMTLAYWRKRLQPLLSSHGGGGEAVAWLHEVVGDDGEPDQALSFAPDNFPLQGVAGYRSVSHRPLIYGDTTPQPRAEGDEPDVALLASMATCLNHGFGMLPHDRQRTMLNDMRKLWAEVVGLGYYRPERRDFYLQALAAAPGEGGGIVGTVSPVMQDASACSPVNGSQSATPSDDNRATKGCTYNCDCVGRCKRGLD